MNRQRHLTVLLATIALLFGIVGGATAQSASVFRVGVLAEQDSQLARGAALATRQINNAGGALGADGTPFQLELVYTPVNEINTIEGAVGQLLEANVIAVIGPQTTAEVTAYLPVLQQLNVPILTTATGDNIIISDNTDLVFRIRATDFLIARGLAEYVIVDQAINNIALYQFDAEATANAFGFQSAAQGFEIAVPPAQLITNEAEIAAATDNITNNGAQAVIGYGNPTIAGQFYTALRASGYTGLFGYSRPNNTDFVGGLSTDLLDGIVGSNTWSFAATDQLSTRFTLDYLRAYREIPDVLAAASYDAILLLEEAIGAPGQLRTNLSNIQGIFGIQGILSPANLNPGEMSNNVAVFEFGDNGEVSVVARFAGTERLPEGEEDAPLATPTPTPTPAPDGVIATVVSSVQNVRSGPSTDFNVIGQLEEGDEVQIIGANADFSWLVIEFRGQQGWIANLSNLNEIFGDLNTVTLITPPPTPTPAATAIPAATGRPAQADVVVQSASVSPNPIVPNQTFTLSVTLANVGASNAGQFAVAATFQPGDVFTSATVGSLAAGQTTTVTLTGTLSTTGTYSTVIVADLNNQIVEGEGESNNNFSFNYKVDQPNAGTGTNTIENVGTFDFGNTVTINWDGTNLQAGSGFIGKLEGVAFDNVHYDLINQNSANQSTITPVVGDVIGIYNNNGSRGVLRVDQINGSTIVGTFRTYNAAN